MLLHIAQGTAPAQKPKQGQASNFTTGIQPCPAGEKGEFAVLPVLLSTIEGISHIRIFLPKDIKGIEARNTALKSVQEVKRRFPDGIALLDPIDNMGIVDDDFKKLLKVSPFHPKRGPG